MLSLSLLIGGHIGIMSYFIFKINICLGLFWCHQALNRASVDSCAGQEQLADSHVHEVAQDIRPLWFGHKCGIWPCRAVVLNLWIMTWYNMRCIKGSQHEEVGNPLLWRNNSGKLGQVKIRKPPDRSWPIQYSPCVTRCCPEKQRCSHTGCLITSELRHLPASFKAIVFSHSSSPHSRVYFPAFNPRINSVWLRGTHWGVHVLIEEVPNWVPSRDGTKFCCWC